MADDAKWQASFKATTDEQWDKMIQNVRDDIAKGRCVERGFDEI